MARATVTAKRLAAALALQPPSATPIAIRDRAILLLTFASRRRRAEIAGLNIRAPRFQSQRVCDPHDPHEPDQAGAGQFVPGPRIENGPCAVAALDAWSTAQIMDVTGHRDPKSLRCYTRRELLHDPVLPKLFEPEQCRATWAPQSHPLSAVLATSLRQSHPLRVLTRELRVEQTGGWSRSGPNASQPGGAYS
jgi:hypothetical protein